MINKWNYHVRKNVYMIYIIRDIKVFKYDDDNGEN